MALGLVVGPAAPTRAEMAPPTVDPPRAVLAGADFAPREEAVDGPDWIQLKSGEWLQGSLDRIRVDALDFDSDELDSLNLDFDDVFAVLTAGPQTLNLESREVVTGLLAVRGDVIRVRTADGVRTLDRRDVVGVVPGRPKERNYWSGTVSVGLALQRGNTDQTDLSGLATLMRETARTRGTAKYSGAVSTVRGAETGNNHRVNTQADVFVTRRFYVTVLSFEYFTDRFQNIDMRLVPGAGIGYALVDTGRTTIDLELGAGATFTRASMPPLPVTVRDKTTASLIMRLAFDTDVTEFVEWNGEYRLQLGVPQTSQTFHHALTTLSVDIWGDFDLDTTFVWDRNQAAAWRPTPTSPVPDDFRLTFGLGWDF